MASLMGDLVNTQMLGMSKAVSDDSARRALKRMDEEEGIDLLDIIRNYDVLIIDIKSPEITEHIALVAQHIVSSQLFKLKVDSYPKNGRFKHALADIWERRVMVVID